MTPLWRRGERKLEERRQGRSSRSCFTLVRLTNGTGCCSHVIAKACSAWLNVIGGDDWTLSAAYSSFWLVTTPFCCFTIGRLRKRAHTDIVSSRDPALALNRSQYLHTRAESPIAPFYLQEAVMHSFLCLKLGTFSQSALSTSLAQRARLTN